LFIGQSTETNTTRLSAISSLSPANGVALEEVEFRQGSGSASVVEATYFWTC
jgi:hypothetical protein